MSVSLESPVINNYFKKKVKIKKNNNNCVGITVDDETDCVLTACVILKEELGHMSANDDKS